MKEERIQQIYQQLEKCYSLLCNDYQDKRKLAIDIVASLSDEDTFSFFNEDKKQQITDIFAPIFDAEYEQIVVKRACDFLLLKANEDMGEPIKGTPEIIGLMLSVIIDKSVSKEKIIIDPVAGVGTLLATIKCHIPNVRAIGCFNDIDMINWMKALAKAIHIEAEISTEDPLKAEYPLADYFISDIPSYLDGEYFPHDMTLKAMDSLNDDGKIIWIVSERFLLDGNKEEFQRELKMRGSVETIIKLPKWFFQNEAKDIYVINKDVSNNHCTVLEFPDEDSNKQTRFFYELLKRYNIETEN